MDYMMPRIDEKYPNPSGLSPLGCAVLVKMYTPELVAAAKKSGLVIPDSVVNSQNTLDQRAIVIAVGPHAWHDEPAPRAKPGDRVLVTKYAGFLCNETADGQMYRLVNDRDLFCRIDWDKEAQNG